MKGQIDMSGIHVQKCILKMKWVVGPGAKKINGCRHKDIVLDKTVVSDKTNHKVCRIHKTLFINKIHKRNILFSQFTKTSFGLNKK